MPPRMGDAVAVAVPVVVLLAAAAVGVVVIARQDTPPPAQAPAAPLPTSQTQSGTPSGTPADRGSPAGLRRSPSAERSHPVRRSPSPSPLPDLPTATSSICVARHKHLELTVVTFNIHSARARDGSVHLDAIANELARWQPDVVLLQEVDRGRAWTGRVDMPAVLGDRLGMVWTFGANVRRSATNQYGTAILSRFPIVASRNVPLPAPRGTQQRGLLSATVDVRGIRVDVYDTHLENTSRAARVQQMRAIAPILRADPRPKLFGGDLNSVPSSTVLSIARSLLTDTWPGVGAGAGYTAPGAHPRLRIDHLLYAGGAGVEMAPVAARVLPSSVSDHRAVRATYRLSAEGSEICVPDL